MNGIGSYWFDISRVCETHKKIRNSKIFLASIKLIILSFYDLLIIALWLPFLFFICKVKFVLWGKKIHCSRFRSSKQNLIKVEWRLVKRICQGKLKKKPMLFLIYPLRFLFNCFPSLLSKTTRSEYRHVVNGLEVAHIRLCIDVWFSYLQSSSW